MDFILKLFKAFNSAQSPWQMSLALSLGMAMGLTPYSGVQTILLIFIALIFNIHFGLFLVSSAFFAGIAYFADPYFEALGFLVLNMESLQNLFTTAYNSSLLRLTYFNNTMVMGSTLIAFASIIPMFLILNKVVYLYRDKIAAKLQKFGFFSTLGVEVVAKKDKLFRLWGVIVFVLFGALGTAFVVLFLDDLAKTAFERNLSSTLNKHVTLSKLTVSFKEGSINLDNLNISDEKEIIVQTENINFDIDFNQLLFQRYHIENIAVTGMTFNKTIEKNTKNAVQADESSSNNNAKTETEGSDFELPSLSLEEPQVLIDRVGLSSLKDYERAELEIKEINEKYTKNINTSFSQTDIDSINSDIKGLQTKIKVSSIKDALSLKKDINSLQTTLKQKSTVLKKMQSDFNKDRATIQKHYATLKNGASSDYKNLKSQYSLDSSGGVNIIGVLFGDKIKSYMGGSLEYYEMIKPYLGSDNEDENETIVARSEGRWIVYKETIPSLSLWIKQVKASGEIKDQNFKFLIEDISSDQKILNKAMTFSFKSDGVKLKKLSIIGEDNHLEEKSQTDAVYTLLKGKVKQLDLSFLSLERATYTLEGSINIQEYNKLTSKTTVKFNNTQLQLKSEKGDLMKSLSQIITKIDTFDLKIKVDGSVLKPNFSVRSDLDKKLSSAFSDVFKVELEKYKKELKILLNKEASKQLKALGVEEKSMNDIDDLINAQTSSNEVLQTRVDKLDQELKDKANAEIDKQKKRAEAEIDKQKRAAEKKAKKEADKEKKKAEKKAKNEANKALKSLGF